MHLSLSNWDRLRMRLHIASLKMVPPSTTRIRILLGLAIMAAIPLLFFAFVQPFGGILDTAICCFLALWIGGITGAGSVMEAQFGLQMEDFLTRILDTETEEEKASYAKFLDNMAKASYGQEPDKS